VEVLRFESISNPPYGTFTSPKSIITHLNNLVQLGVIFLLLQRATGGRSRRFDGRRPLGIGSQIDAGSRPLQRLISICTRSFWICGWVAGGGSASGRRPDVLMHVDRWCLDTRSACVLGSECGLVSTMVIGGWRIAMSGWCYDGSGLRAPWYRTGRELGKKKIEMRWVKRSEAKWAVARMDVCLKERERGCRSCS